MKSTHGKNLLGILLVLILIFGFTAATHGYAGTRGDETTRDGL